MDELTDLIVNELGPKAKDYLPDFLNPEFQKSDKNKKIEIIKTLLLSDKYTEIKNLVNIIAKQKTNYNGKFRTKLATTIPQHDLIQHGLAISNVEYILKQANNYKENNNIEKINLLIEQINLSLNIYRSYCLSMAYLASDGNDQFNPKIKMLNTCNLEAGHCYYIFNSNSCKNIFSSNSIENKDIIISTATFVSMEQMLNNAQGIPLVTYEVDSSYSKIMVKDYGDGIKDKNQKPLLPTKIKKIFGNFSSKSDFGIERGTGLKKAKELIHLEKGYISVETTSKGHPTYQYDTKLNICRVIPRTEEGVKFTIYIPHET